MGGSGGTSGRLDGDRGSLVLHGSGGRGRACGGLKKEPIRGGTAGNHCAGWLMRARPSPGRCVDGDTYAVLVSPSTVAVRTVGRVDTTGWWWTWTPSPVHGCASARSRGPSTVRKQEGPIECGGRLCADGDGESHHRWAGRWFPLDAAGPDSGNMQ